MNGDLASKGHEVPYRICLLLASGHNTPVDEIV